MDALPFYHLVAIQTFEPSPKLRPFVRQYFVIEIHCEGLNYNLITPSGFPFMYFPYPSKENDCRAYPFLDVGIENSLYRMDDVYLFGQAKSAYQAWSSGSMNVVKVIFEVGGAAAIFRVNMSDFTNIAAKLSEIYTFSELPFMSERLYEAKNNLQRIAIVEKFLSQVLLRKRTDKSTIDHASTMIIGQNGRITVEEISEKMGMTRRTLERRFLEKAGISPQQLIKSLRFRLLLRHLMMCPDADYMEIIAHFNYFDQSHLIKDFHKFVGLSPENYFKVDQKLVDSYLKILR